MKPGLAAGMTHRLTYRVPATKTVRHIYTEATEFQQFPEVLATGFFIALLEWACTQALQPYLEPGEGSLGVHVDVSHSAATPPGMDITVVATFVGAEGKRLTWDLVAHDGIDEIGRGRHVRAVIDRARFERRLAQKIADAKARTG
jgi:fluoroacetyl-CoA thioesterase